MMLCNAPARIIATILRGRCKPQPQTANPSPPAAGTPPHPHPHPPARLLELQREGAWPAALPAQHVRRLHKRAAGARNARAEALERAGERLQGGGEAQGGRYASRRVGQDLVGMGWGLGAGMRRQGGKALTGSQALPRPPNCVRTERTHIEPPPPTPRQRACEWRDASTTRHTAQPGRLLAPPLLSRRRQRTSGAAHAPALTSR